MGAGGAAAAALRASARGSFLCAVLARARSGFQWRWRLAIVIIVIIVIVAATGMPRLNRELCRGKGSASGSRTSQGSSTRCTLIDCWSGSASSSASANGRNTRCPITCRTIRRTTWRTAGDPAGAPSTVRGTAFCTKCRITCCTAGGWLWIRNSAFASIRTRAFVRGWYECWCQCECRYQWQCERQCRCCLCTDTSACIHTATGIRTRSGRSYCGQ